MSKKSVLKFNHFFDALSIMLPNIENRPDGRY